MDQFLLHGPSSSAERTDKPFYISKKIKKSDSKVFGSSRRDWKKRRIYEKGKESNNPKGILSGVYVYFLGFSEEPQSKIKKIINQNGGIVLNYLAGTNITHIICRSNRIIKPRNVHQDIPYVSVDWILESCKQKKKLPEHQFLVLESDSKQPKMEKFFDKSLELIDNTNNMNNMNNMNNENEEEKEEEEEITEIIQETKVENKYQWSTTSKSITNSNNSPKTTSTIPVPFVTSKLRPLSKNLVLSNKKPLSKTLKEFLPRAHNLKNTKQTNF